MSHYLSIEQDCILVRRICKNIEQCLKISYKFKIVIYSQDQQQIQAVPKGILLSHQSQFHAILGIKAIKNIPFFVVVRQQSIVCTFYGSQICQIKSIDWIPITKDSSILQNTQVQQQLNNISKIFQQGLYYYSSGYQLFSTFLLNLKQNGQNQLRYYEQFVWNNNIIKIDVQNQFMATFFGQSKQSIHSYNQQSKIFTKWCTPIIQGYVNYFQTILPDKAKIQYMLISRRSNKKAGTRFFSRGIDDNGNVANYTQSQQIIQYRDIVLTNIQLRGSVPVFFEQIGMQGINIQLNIQRTKQLTKKPFLLHFSNMKQQYERVLCINLLAQHKKSQEKLTNFFQQMIETTLKQLSSQIKYQYFDFHQQCKNNQFENSEKLITKIEDVIKAFGFNCYDRAKNLLLKAQSGVFRTNCLDCLDRTNYVQSRIALQSLKLMLQQYGSVELQRQAASQYGLLKQPQFQLNSQLLNLFNSLWAQNGDSVSLHYTGIGSTHTDITKIGKRTLFGTVNHKMRSLMRFYTQFTDVHKHDVINQFLGNKSLLRFNQVTKQEMHTQQQNILVCSWQFSDPSKSLQEFQRNPQNNKIYQFLLSQVQQNMGTNHSILVLYLYVPNEIINWQSGVNFGLKQFLKSSFKDSLGQLVVKWGDFVTSQLQSSRFNFFLIDMNQYDSCRMLIFCKKNRIQHISNIKKDEITSTLKTKQSVLLTKFKFYESSLVFQAFNVKNISNFNQYLQKAHEKGFQQNILGRSKSTTISQQSYRLVLGNVGSQSRLSQEQFRSLQRQFQSQSKQSKNWSSNNVNVVKKSYPGTESSKITKLIAKSYEMDQLKQLLESSQSMSLKNKVLLNYNQAPLQFIPLNNRVLFWNQENKIVRAKSYGKVNSGSHSNQKDNQINPQDDEETNQSCVFLKLSYEIQVIK